MTHPPGTILVISSDLARYSAFGQSLALLKAPEGSNLVWMAGADIAFNGNSGLAKRTGEWVWIIGDDHVFGADLLTRLLDHEVDVVAPVVLKRKPPYMALVYRDGPTHLMPIPREELPASGLHQVAASSGSGILIREHVLKEVEQPFYEYGRMDRGIMTEDLWLQHKIRAAGYQLYIDFDSVMGHQTPAVVWPVRTADGQWRVVVDPGCGVPSEASPPTLNEAQPTATAVHQERFT